MTFLKTILILLLVYFGLRILLKLLRPYILRYIARRAEKHFERTFGNNPFKEPAQTREGEVTIDKMPSKERKASTDVGEYVDYEEID